VGDECVGRRGSVVIGWGRVRGRHGDGERVDENRQKE
jgi:hypothetical protein